ncbi:MAG: bifunctional oligoribonuclease/PAP phosphatase NrnA [Clostridiaceae bacterium]|jgi:phosphoesterase RecJ-like protein|nr:bifunctional oligoribonuclease/PAP phosphatase NrnA [Clostridiaceae bacterium]
MTNENNYQALSAALKNADSIGIFSHVSPDGDTIGSGLALYGALKALGKTVFIACADPIPQKLLFLPGAAAVTQNPPKAAKPLDLAIAVDTASYERLGVFGHDFSRAKNTAVIDHHKSNPRYGKINIVVECAATAEIIYRILKENALLSDDAAACLFAGIVTDSGCFAFSSVTPETHAIAAELMNGFKFDAENIIYNTYRAKSLQVFKLRNAVLSKCKFYNDGQIAVVSIFQSDLKDTGAGESDTEGIVTDGISIIGVEVAFSLTEMPNKQFKVSIRTKNYVDANDCAAAFGGGGHTRAAGCRLSGNYYDIVDKLLKVARDRL